MNYSVRSIKFISIYFDNRITWSINTDEIVNKVDQVTGQLNPILGENSRCILDMTLLLYRMCIELILDVV